ncbi:hypothetical protein WA026_019900 [Henosepilachna vigintioctopunctata]|uniref:Chitin-binding type-2 domain-containing protein n=1 Tax=Henosepilachna vigintioctopunctata TaxID=420089 RepID=A0AAW1VB68_9CUCU
MKWCYVIGFSLLLNSSLSIYTPYNNPRKSILSPVIKTLNWKNSQSENVVINHNYSHVNYQYQQPGSSLTPTQNFESTTKKFYPIYKPHAENNLGQNSLNEGQDQTISQQKIIIRVKKQLQVYDKCPPGATGQFVFSLACNQFLNCWKGRGSPQNCAPGTLFNPDTLTCDFPEKVRCITGPRRTIYEESPTLVSHTVIKKMCNLIALNNFLDVFQTTQIVRNL